MLKLQMIGAAVLLLGMFYIICLIRRKRMELKYALPWLAVSVAALLVDCFPELLSALADLLGIATPVNALFLAAFLFSVCLLFALTVIVSRQSERIKQLAQAAALCEERVRRLENEKAEKRSDTKGENRKALGEKSGAEDTAVGHERTERAVKSE